jgi:alpha-glucosidase
VSTTGTDRSTVPTVPEAAWWQTAVVYQVYLRSFADANGDGVGDIAGLRNHLPYLARLGVGALWINPWYPSPMEDAGYDVADYRSIASEFGTLDDAEHLIADAHSLGLKVLLDIVPNHTSTEHAWFQAALAGDDSARRRYVFRPGRGDHGELPPNDWQSNFGGPAWTRVKDNDGNQGDWYLHLFTPAQPDLDWTNDDVKAEFDSILRFWFDRDVDGFRIDVAHGLAKAPGFPDAGPRNPGQPSHNETHPAWDQDEVHHIYRDWRRVADSFDPPRVFVGEVWVPDNERLARYLRADELHSAFHFDFLRAPWRSRNLRQVIKDGITTGPGWGSTITWVLSNHDVVRQVTRYARSQPDGPVESGWERRRWSSEPADIALGTRRARAAILLALALPGTVYLYQGEELGLPEVEDIPSDRRDDPIWWQSDKTDPGRDGCRVPMPWSGERPPFGFSPAEATTAPWLPQPEDWATLTVESEEADPDSMLHLYRDALRIRGDHLAGPSSLQWVNSAEEVLAFRRGDVECWVNTSSSDVTLPDAQVLLASGPGPHERVLPTDTATWLVAS